MAEQWGHPQLRHPLRSSVQPSSWRSPQSAIGDACERRLAVGAVDVVVAPAAVADVAGAAAAVVDGELGL